MKYQMKIALITVLLVLFLPVIGQTAEMPGAPSGLKLIIEGKGFQLTWMASPNDPGDVTGYEIARATVASGPFETIGHVKKGVVKYQDRKAQPENIYYYKVRAISGKSGEKYSSYSNMVTGELKGN